MENAREKMDKGKIKKKINISCENGKINEGWM